MSKKTTIILGIWSLFVFWTISGWAALGRVEHPEFTVIERYDGYELRAYQPYLTAQVPVAGSSPRAFNEGYDLLTAYIGGDNTIEPGASSERIADAVPVTQESRNGSSLVSFALPSRYVQATVPRPNDPRIRLMENPDHKVAVMQLSGGVGQGQLSKAQDALAKRLAQDHVVILGPFRLVRSGARWAPPFARRAELMVNVR